MSLVCTSSPLEFDLMTWEGQDTIPKACLASLYVLRRC